MRIFCSRDPAVRLFCYCVCVCTRCLRVSILHVARLIAYHCRVAEFSERNLQTHKKRLSMIAEPQRNCSVMLLLSCDRYGCGSDVSVSVAWPSLV